MKSFLGKSNSTDLKSFLMSRRVMKKQTSTHTSMFPYKISVNISDEELEAFYQLYYQWVFVEGKETGLTERNRDQTPIKIDLDFKYNLEDNFMRRYKIQDIMKIISLYMEIIEEWYVLKPNERMCFVMEKTTPRKKSKYIKDGIHIIFPFIVTDTKIQYLFREHVLSKIDSILDGQGLINEYSDIIDESVIQKNGWLLYGSTKPDDTNAYEVSHVFNAYVDYEKIEEIDNPFSDEAMVRVLSIRSHFNPDDKTMLRQEKEAELVEKYEDIQHKYYKTYNQNTEKPKALRELNEDELKLIKMLVGCFNEERACNYEDWINVGFALHNLGTNNELLDIWIDFSKMSLRHQDECETSCYKQWHSMTYGNIGMGSLRHWSELDNPSKYKNVRFYESRKPIEESLNVLQTGNKTIDDVLKKKVHINPDSVAEVLHAMYKDDFRMVGKKGRGEYFQYNSHRWKQMDGHLLLREKIRSEVKERYFEHIQKVFNKTSPSFNPDQCDTIIQELTQDPNKLLKVINSLSSTNFKNQVMDEAKEFFYDRTQSFLNNLDSNPNLLGFENGVYDLLTGKFRKGIPEDNISMTTKIEYHDFGWFHERVEQVMEFIDQILPVLEVREYVLTILGSFLNGENPNERFHIWTGTGGNGKSKLIELFEMSIGDYSCKLPITLLTNRRKGSNEAQPELARTKGKRSAILQEPDEHTRINVGLMKEMTGGDTIIARNLYEQPIEFKPQIKMILICNHLPELPYDDEATWRRVRAVEFESKFVDRDKWDKNDKHQYPKDDNLSQNFKYWKEPFIWILLQYYKKYIEEGIKEPSQVTECTSKYKEQNDHFAEFFQNYLIYNQLKEEILSIRQIYNHYRQIAIQNSEKPKKMSDLKKYLEKQIGPIIGSGMTAGWKGWDIKDRDIIDDDNSSTEESLINELAPGQDKINKN